MRLSQTLSARIVIRLRTLVVLPTRDLVMQVRDVFEHFARGTGLKVGTATGQHSFAHEQAALVGDMPETGHQPQLGGTSKVDILICTPGRLMDHLKATKGFSLQHLRFLVIDEADRLLNQSFNDWLKTILSHVELNVANAIEIDGEDDAEDGSIAQSDDAVAPALLHRVRRLSQTDLDVTLGPSVRPLANGIYRRLTGPHYERRPRSCSSPRRLPATRLGCQLSICTIQSTLR